MNVRSLKIRKRVTQRVNLRGTCLPHRTNFVETLSHIIMREKGDDFILQLRLNMQREKHKVSYPPVYIQ